MRSLDIVPEAYFDCLTIAVGIPKSVSPLSFQELHLFAYLGCLLALFEGRPLSAWGYRFALTSRGYPFSAEFEDARKSLIDAQLLHMGDGGSVVAGVRAAAELEGLNALSSLADRRHWLRTAMDCALALPVGSIRYAVTARQDLAEALFTGRSSTLLTPDFVERVHDERHIIEKALGASAFDLLAPAVAWLSLYVLESEEVST